MKTGFFEEKEGVKSSTRLNSFILLFALIILDGLWFYANNDISGNFIIFNLLMLVGVFAPKYLHKIAEAKIPNLKQDDKP